VFAAGSFNGQKPRRQKRMPIAISRAGPTKAERLLVKERLRRGRLTVTIVSMSQVNGFGGGLLWDRSGLPWRRTAEWLDPAEVNALLAAGASWLIQWCGQRGFTWSDEAELTAAEVCTKLLNRKRARRLLGKRTTRTVIVAERWQDESGRDLVVFFESSPAPRAAAWFT
jgi:hypothetical protein